MAKIKDPLDFRWRDKKGGIVGCRLYSQDGARVAATQVYRPSAVRQKFERDNAGIVKAWRQLDDHEQAEWDIFGSDFPGTDKYGDAITWGGFQWFTRLNAGIRKGDGAHILAPPLDPWPDYDASFWGWFDRDAEELLLGFDYAPTGSNYFYVGLSVPNPPSRRSSLAGYEFVGSYKFPTVSPIVIKSVPGPWLESQRHGWKAVGVDSFGRRYLQHRGGVYTGPEEPSPWNMEARRDVVLYDNEPDHNFGWSIWGLVKGAVDQEIYWPLWFNMEELPAGAVVTNAILSLYCSKVWDAGNVDAHKVLVAWQEFHATWNDRVWNVAWGAPGGQAGVDFVAAPGATTNVNVGEAWYQWGIAGMVQDWVADPGSNHGVWMRTGVPGAFVLLWTRETFWVTQAPYLTVFFTT